MWQIVERADVAWLASQAILTAGRVQHHTLGICKGWARRRQERIARRLHAADMAMLHAACDPKGFVVMPNP